ncbi:hypothetical protein KIW84_064041 [Lathyrus oleraceus]|uniref:Uncharacterized protein n=1 Tax=Pisum sativum TaxID=3888 RepID=A0A9D4WB47_PEA|nr:hypothetical protein KIW84_064041 [Pisum sativum]
MAEDEEDDESFGDFKFASFPNQPLPSTSAWGNFANHSNHINGTTVSKPFDPFPVSPDPLGKTANKARGGAIPLSIFGDEDDEPVSDSNSNSNDFFSNGCGGVVKKGSDSNGSVGISDLISNLYNQQNGSASVSNVGPTGPKNSNVNNLNQDEDEDDDGWEFKSAERETGNENLNDKVQTPKHGNGAVGVGALLDSSAAFSDKVGEWNPGFWEVGECTFMARIKSNFAPKKDNIYPTAIEALNDDGRASHSTVDPSLASQSHQSNGWGFDFNLKSSSMGQNGLFSESYFKTENNYDVNNKSNASPTNINVDSDVNLFESKDAVTEIGIKHEKPLIASENRREALPLSIFGDDMPDTNEHLVSQDLSPRAPVSPMQNNINSPGSNLSINDLIWSLYSQSEDKTSPNVTPKANENQIRASPELSGSGLDHSDDLDDDFGDFKDASPETTLTQESAQNTSLNHPTEVTENGLQTSLDVLNSDLINDNDGFEDDSWEFKDAISGKSTQDQASTIDHRDLLTQLSSKLEPSDCVEFFSTLKDELCNNVLFHLQNLKVARDVVALSGEDAKTKALEVEIQEFSQILHQHHMSIPVESLRKLFAEKCKL